VTSPRPVLQRVDTHAGPGRTAAGTRSTGEAGRPAHLRLATDDDLTACTHVWRAGLIDYLGRLNQPEFPTDLERLRRLLAHLRTTDPDRFWVATRPALPIEQGRPEIVGRERVVGFVSANVRGHAWFLAMLFVEPSEQGVGLGRLLLERSLDGLAEPTSAPRTDGQAAWAFGTATDAVQPISNALYARYGLVPRVPVVHLLGSIDRPAAFRSLPTGVQAVPFSELEAETVARDVAAIDRVLLGYEHPQDHAWLGRDRRIGFLYRDGEGNPLGFGYTSPAGRVGPIAALDADLLAPLTGHLLSAFEPNGAFSAWIPGSAGELITSLLRAGFRIEGFPALMCWSRPYVDVSRYVPNTLALL
jgi:GNAT superfamily N-acetyltransferase